MEKLPCLTLNRHAENRLKLRHPWIFSNEIADAKLMKRFGPGAQVDILDCHGDYVGTGFLNPNSLIAVRILTRTRGQELDADFFAHKIKSALAMRETVYGKDSPYRSTYRAVFGESDGLPGLIVDRYQGAWVVEPHSLGMHMRKADLLSALSAVMKEHAPGDALVYRTDHRSATLEGITPETELAFGKIPKDGVFAVEDDIHFVVDPMGGQKTGFFFDQRENRAFFRRWLEKSGGGQTVLDIFCHAGAWGFRALAAGAEKVVFVDSSKDVLASVQATAARMKMEKRIEVVTSDGLEFLKGRQMKEFHAIALDPPALVPNKKALPAGIRHYRDLNAAAFRALRAGGVLSSSSCSYHVQEEKFEEMVHRAAIDSESDAKLLWRGGLALDHPALLGVSEGRYLKNLFLAKI